MKTNSPLSSLLKRCALTLIVVLTVASCANATFNFTDVARPEGAQPNAEQRQAHHHALRNFVLGGAELTGQARTRFAEIQEKQAELSQKFSENTLDATDAFCYFAASEELDGVPTDVQQTALLAAQAEGKAGYKLTLKMPCYLPVMQFANSSALREKLYRAYVTRASDQVEGDSQKFNNTNNINAILALRLEEAKLLGYPNFGAVSVVSKMADSPEAVVTFLRDLARKARPFAEKDLADLRAFAKDELQLTDPQAWAALVTLSALEIVLDRGLVDDWFSSTFIVAFAAISGVPVFGLPGNPVSSIVCTLLFVAALLCVVLAMFVFVRELSESLVALELSIQSLAR